VFDLGNHDRVGWIVAFFESINMGATIALHQIVQSKFTTTKAKSFRSASQQKLTLPLEGLPAVQEEHDAEDTSHADYVA
jgi:hypothetical protein